DQQRRRDPQMLSQPFGAETNLDKSDSTSPAEEVRHQRLHLNSIDGAKLDSLFVGQEPQPAFLDRLNAEPARRAQCEPPGYFDRIARKIGLESVVQAAAVCDCGGSQCPCAGCGIYAASHSCQSFNCDTGHYRYPMPEPESSKIGTWIGMSYDCSGLSECGCTVESCYNEFCP
ncbi:MAG: hypothetical protein ACK5AZ_25950, partial [Bryobacteraceae bacterium]